MLWCDLFGSFFARMPDKDSENQALHEATHGQFGEEPRPVLMPNVEDKPSEFSNIQARIGAARKKLPHHLNWSQHIANALPSEELPDHAS
jgi:hypothetical protein